MRYMAQPKVKYNKVLQKTDGKQPGARSLVETKVGNKNLITFSFKYWDQREFFSIGDKEAGWFVSLFNRLGDLNGKTSEIVENYTERDQYRLHPIDWSGKNVPVSLDDLENIPTVLREAAKKSDEPFLWQFQLSTANGRVIGFFNEEYDKFYIVLLDPNHNMQPSGNFGYAVDPTRNAILPYEQIRCQIASMSESLKSCKHCNECPVSQPISEAYLDGNAVYVPIDQELKDTYKEMISNGGFREKLETFLLENLS